MSDKVLAILTQIIVKNIEENNKLPWHRPWFGGKQIIDGVNVCSPRNLITNNSYRGINYMLTAMQGFPSNFWISFEQAKKRKLYIKSGQHYTPIVKWIIDENEDGKTIYKGCKYFQVYNLSQFKDWETVITPDSEIDTSKIQSTNSMIEECETLIKGYKNPPTIKTGNNASYSPISDSVTIPNLNNFISSEHYYATLIHELVHSTGHENRLKRKGISEGMDGFGGKNYSFEELVAEIGSCFLCNYSGIDSEKVFENSVAYIQSWLQKFKNDVSMLPKAAQLAQKAVDLILGTKFENNFVQ